MTIPIDDQTIGVWLVQAGTSVWVLTLSKGSGDEYTLRDYFNSTLRDTLTTKFFTEAEFLALIRPKIHKIMEAHYSDKGWEALRGMRTREEYMKVLRGLPWFREKISNN